MHASLWILIVSNGILSLPHMSVRLQPPSSDSQKSRWKWHGSYVSAFVPLSVRDISWKDLCLPCEKEANRVGFFFWFLHFSMSPLSLCQSFESTLSCHDSFRSRCLAVKRDAVAKQALRTCECNRNVFFTLVVLCVIRCLCFRLYSNCVRNDSYIIFFSCTFGFICVLSSLHLLRHFFEKCSLKKDYFYVIIIMVAKWKLAYKYWHYVFQLQVLSTKSLENC